MLYEIMQYLRNYFIVEDGTHEGTFLIEGGTINLPFLLENQWFLIHGSVFNDGVYQYLGSETAIAGLDDEEFTGLVCALAIPKDLIKIVAEIEEWQEKNADTGIFQSESFGGYSYTKASGKYGGAVTWQDSFGQRLKRWRKI